MPLLMCSPVALLLLLICFPTKSFVMKLPSQQRQLLGDRCMALSPTDGLHNKNGNDDDDEEEDYYVDDDDDDYDDYDDYDDDDTNDPALDAKEELRDLMKEFQRSFKEDLDSSLRDLKSDVRDLKSDVRDLKSDVRALKSQGGRIESRLGLLVEDKCREEAMKSFGSNFVKPANIRSISELVRVTFQTDPTDSRDAFPKDCRGTEGLYRIESAIYEYLEPFIPALCVKTVKTAFGELQTHVDEAKHSQVEDFIQKFSECERVQGDTKEHFRQQMLGAVKPLVEGAKKAKEEAKTGEKTRIDKMSSCLNGLEKGLENKDGLFKGSMGLWFLKALASAKLEKHTTWCDDDDDIWGINSGNHAKLLEWSRTTKSDFRDVGPLEIDMVGSVTTISRANDQQLHSTIRVGEIKTNLGDESFNEGTDQLAICTLMFEIVVRFGFQEAVGKKIVTVDRIGDLYCMEVGDHDRGVTYLADGTKVVVHLQGSG